MFLIFQILLFLSSNFRGFASTEIENWTKTKTFSFIEDLEVTPWGLLAGEKDTRLWNFPFNGIYISRDFGQTWSEFALKDRGITSIYYKDKNLYATTYYQVGGTNGLFISADGGKTWIQYGPKVSTHRVAVDRGIILLGTYSHGLWISYDNGGTWIQRIGEGFTGPQVYAILIKDGHALVSLQNKTLISNGNFESWQEVPQLQNRQIKNLAKINDHIFAGTSNSDGMWYSPNNANTWLKNAAWGNKPVDYVGTFKNTIYAASNGLIYKSYDLGTTWLETNFDNINNKVTSIVGFVGNISNVVASVTSRGIFVSPYIQDPTNPEPFLEIPWNYINEKELIQKVYSFFDHELPLLGYSSFIEPSEIKDSTLNFLGIKDKIPNLYYSNHDGIDFALPFGTNILAAADGQATYNFDKNGLGHYITIEHPNGYRTVYAHLQPHELITNVIGTSTPISRGEVLGRVGMSGNTTGPHLHFAVQKTGVKSPDNRVDPFGWVAKDSNDPWFGYTWTDNNGNHSGSQSHNLWAGENIMQKDINVNVTADMSAVTDNNVSLAITPYSIPKKETYFNKLFYIEGTSNLIELVNLLGEKVRTLDETIKVSLDLSSIDLTEINTKWLKIYFFDEVGLTWIPLISKFDQESSVLETEIDHLSWFAVFGINPNAWQKNLKIEGGQFSIE